MFKAMEEGYQENISQLICARNHTDDVYKLSKLCWSALDIESSNCFPKNYYDDYYLKLFVFIWLIMIITFGVIGNTLTLTAIPYAIWKKRFVNIYKYMH